MEIKKNKYLYPICFGEIKIVSEDSNGDKVYHCPGIKINKFLYEKFFESDTLWFSYRFLKSIFCFQKAIFHQ